MELYRMHLKTEGILDRKELINFCIEENKLAIGWSCLYEEHNIENFKDYINVAQEVYKSIPSAINYFQNVQKDDLIWTRDLEGFYYICRVLNEAQSYCDFGNDIGSIIPVEKYKVDTNVPGKIVNCFCPSRTIQRINDKSMHIYSKMLFNELSGKKIYDIEETQFDLLKMLHPLDLEELIICYLQIRYNYYLSKNSVANKDTTINVECELYSKDINNPYSVVVQVKSGEAEVDILNYKRYIEEGKKVFLFLENQNYQFEMDGLINITREDIIDFVKENKMILPSCIKYWIKFCEL